MTDTGVSLLQAFLEVKKTPTEFGMERWFEVRSWELEKENGCASKEKKMLRKKALEVGISGKKEKIWNWEKESTEAGHVSFLRKFFTSEFYMGRNFSLSNGNTFLSPKKKTLLLAETSFLESPLFFL